jgi:glucose-1-phosphate thymidylyltransferase
MAGVWAYTAGGQRIVLICKCLILRHLGEIVASDSMMDKAVILARGLGTRMRKEDGQAEMSEDQAAIAQTGVKAMIPIDRPFLDYVMHDLAEAGYKRICLVIGPEHDAVRKYYSEVACERLSIEFAVQEKPLGTADAVAAVKEFAGEDYFLVINSDNHYPKEVLQVLRELSGSGLAAFDRDGLLEGSNIPADRITKFAAIQMDDDGYMTGILEKPDAETLKGLKEPICVSMNCWRFGPSIFAACKSIKPSSRGELELPDAVQYSMDKLGEKFKALVVKAPVLDMSCRADVPAVVEKLAGQEVRL